MKQAATATGVVSCKRVIHPLIGVLPGEGIGPMVIDGARRVLAAIESVSDIEAKIETGGPIGLESKRVDGCELSAEVSGFVADIFARHGAIFAGPGGGRFVYDLRKQFDLYVKFSPLKPHEHLLHATRLKSTVLNDVDIVVVRDNIAGVYQGRSTSTSTPNAERVVRHEFAYAEGQVRALASAGVKLAATRTGRVTLAIKASGLPLVSELWSDVVRDVCSTASVELTILDADYCAYQLIQQPDAFDVLITPNLIGDILTDLGAVLLGSRGLTFSGNFSPTGHGVYQTNHGAAFDLVGTDRVNPAGQMLALAMMLRESFNLHREAEWIEAALGKIWQQGWRTADLDMSSEGTVGTDEFTWRVAQVIADGSLDRD